MFKKTILCLALVILFIFPKLVSADASSSVPSVKEFMDVLGLSKSERQKLLSGEVIWKERKEGSEKELSLVVAGLMPSPLKKAIEYVRDVKILQFDKDVIDFHDLGDILPNEEAFAGMKLEANEQSEVSKLLKVKAGSTFNLSTVEIERFKEVKKRLKSDAADDPQTREALVDEYRKILLDRYRAYRTEGLKGTPPYDRGRRKQVHPGKELLGVAERDKVLQKWMPDFYRALVNYPGDKADDIMNRFFWVKLRAEDRPTFVLVHHMYRFHLEYAVINEKHYYVGHSYNSLNITVAGIQVKEGTFVFYENRTSTDQVAGLGGGLKRGIGRKMMSETIVNHFKAIRESLKSKN